MAVKFDKVLQKLRESDEVGVSVSWGDIGGTLSSQTDLNTALSGKLAAASNLSDLADAGAARTNLGLGTSATVDTGTSSGNVPVLDGSGKLSIGVLPGVALNDTFVVADQTAMLALTAETGDIAVRTDLNKTYILKGTSASTLADWQELLTPTDTVQSVFGRSGTVTAQTNDYTWAQIDKTTSSLADITTRNYSDLSGLPTLGTLSSQNGTFSGGGTLATGGFTLTVPATGTAALLGTANTFTARQVIQTTADLPLSVRSTGSYTDLRLGNDTLNLIDFRSYDGTTLYGRFQLTVATNTFSLQCRGTSGIIDFMTGNAAGTLTQAMRIDGSQNVGIGTTTAGEKLTVVGRGIFSLTSSTRLGDIQSILEVNGDYGTNSPIYIFDTRSAIKGSGGNLTFGGYTNAATTPKRFGVLACVKENATAGDQTGAYWFMLNKGAGLDTANPVMMILGSSGNVGIGTTTPSYRLHVNSSASTTIAVDSPAANNANLYFNKADVLSTAIYRPANTDDLRIYQGGVDRVTFSGGKVGIGTTGPSQKLTLSANQTGANQGIPATSGTTQNGLLRLEAGGAYGESLDMGINVSTSFGWIQPTNKSNLAVNYNLVLNPNGGNVGIGTTNPLSNFVVSSSGAQGIELAPNVSTFGLSNINYATSYNRSGAAYTDLVFDMGGAATTAFVLKSGGNVGIGMVTPTAKLHIDQASTTAAIPVLTLDQADLSEEFIRFVSTVGAGNPIDTAAIGTYYGKVRVYVEGVGAKFIALYNS